MVEVTVIIPTYNNEETIGRAIDSIIGQTYKNWKLIIVDDASKDNTPNILKEYVNKYGDKISVITNPTNKGVGISRLNAIKKTKTKYLTFLDSDDYLMPDFLNVNLTLALQKDYDIVYTSFGIEYDHPQNKGEKVHFSIPSGDLDMQGEATPQLHFVQKLKFLTGKLFKTELIKNVPWSKKRIGEDVQTLFFATYLANSVRSSSYVGYIHVFRPGSLLADAPQFFCFCHSTLAEFEILDFLLQHEDWKLFNYLITNSFNNYKTAQNAIMMGLYDEDELKKNKSEWKQIQLKYKTYEKYLNKDDKAKR